MPMRPNPTGGISGPFLPSFFKTVEGILKKSEADVRLLEFFENDGYDINEAVGLKLVLVIW